MPYFRQPACTLRPFAWAAWSWLKELYPAQMPEFSPREHRYCLRLRDETSGVEMDLELDLLRACLHFCVPVLTLPLGAEHEALTFLRWNRLLDCPISHLCFSYKAARREVFVQGCAALTQFDGAASLDAFLNEALDRMAQIKQEAAALIAEHEDPPPPPHLH